jgi:Flp pilus assembly protein TadG
MTERDTQLEAGTGRLRMPRALRRLIRCRSGSAAVEFGLVAIPFLALIFLIVNTALVFYAQQTLQAATSQAARLIMTGQAQQSGMTQAQFKQALCTNASALLDCAGVYINVQTFATFTSVSPLNPIKNGAFDSSQLAFSPGVSGQIEVVQAFYQWPLFATLLGYDLSNVGSGLDLVVATVAFRNEPFN